MHGGPSGARADAEGGSEITGLGKNIVKGIGKARLECKYTTDGKTFIKPERQEKPGESGPGLRRRRRQDSCGENLPAASLL